MSQESCGSNNAKSRIFHNMTPGLSQISGSSDPARIQMYFDTDDEDIETELQTSSWAEDVRGVQYREGQAGSIGASPEGLHPFCCLTLNFA